jgi:hypothetical protein
MGRGAFSVFVFGIYLFAVGVSLVVVPNAFLGVAGLPPTGEVWIRVVGVLVLCIATYYTLAARAGITAFLRWTVGVRVGVTVLFTAFVALRLVAAPLLVFAVIDLAGAVWTALALRADASA